MHNQIRAGGSHQLLPSMRPGFKSQRRRHMLVLSLSLVLSLAPRRFFREDFSPGTSVSPLLKSNNDKLLFDLELTDTFKRVLKNS